jgi:hypothetical protein
MTLCKKLVSDVSLRALMLCQGRRIWDLCDECRTQWFSQLNAEDSEDGFERRPGQQRG